MQCECVCVCVLPFGVGATWAGFAASLPPRSPTRSFQNKLSSSSLSLLSESREGTRAAAPRGSGAPLSLESPLPLPVFVLVRFQL